MHCGQWPPLPRDVAHVRQQVSNGLPRCVRPGATGRSLQNLHDATAGAAVLDAAGGCDACDDDACDGGDAGATRVGGCDARCGIATSW